MFAPQSSMPFLWSVGLSHTNLQLGILEVGFEDEVRDVSQEDRMMN